MFSYGMLRRRFIHIAITLLAGLGTLSAQEFKYGVDFVTLFDNTEYVSMEQQWSETIFSARSTPNVALDWNGGNELVVAVDLTKDFGDNANMLSSEEVQLYYSYHTNRFTFCFCCILFYSLLFTTLDFYSLLVWIFHCFRKMFGI